MQTIDFDCTLYAQAALNAGCSLEQFLGFLRAGIVLQPRQLEASVLAMQCDIPGGPTEIGFGGARGGGKSHWMVGQMALDCLRFDGLKCLMLRKVQKANNENFNDLRVKVLKGIKCRYVANPPRLTFENGSSIRLGNFRNEGDVDSHIGMEYDVIGVEEATTLSESKYDMIRTCNRTSKPGWRPRMYSTTNPGGVGHAWYRRDFVDPAVAGLRGDTRFVTSTVDDNQFVNLEYRGILDRLTGWKKRAWRDGDWDLATGQFFTTFRRDVHVIANNKDLSGIRRWWCAIDYGFHHYTVLYLFAMDGDGNIFVVHEHAQREWPVKLQADAIHAMLALYGLRASILRGFVGGADLFSRDSNGAKIADEYLANRIRIKPANDDRVSGAGMMLKLFGDMNPKPAEGHGLGNAGDSGNDAGAVIGTAKLTPILPRLFILERNTRLIATLPTLQYSDANREDVKKIDIDENGRGGDDAYDACRYGLMVPFQRDESPVFDPTTMYLKRKSD